MIIVGLDISSFQINACYLEPNGFTLRTEIIGKQGHDTLVERIQRIPTALMRLLAFLPDPDWLVVEEPFGGRNMPKALLLVAGAILASTPSEVRPWLITPMDWREAIGARNNKPAGHEKVNAWLEQFPPHLEPKAYTHDELDAIGISLGARKILEAQC